MSSTAESTLTYVSPNVEEFLASHNENIKLKVTCTKRTDFLFYHDHLYDFDFNSTRVTSLGWKLTENELLEKLEKVKKVIDGLEDQRKVDAQFTYESKDAICGNSLENSTGENCKKVFNSFLRDLLFKCSDRNVKKHEDLYAIKYPSAQKQNN